MLRCFPNGLNDAIAVPYVPFQILDDVLLEQQQLILLFELLLDKLKTVLIRKRIGAFTLVELLRRCIQAMPALPDIQPYFAEFSHELVLTGRLGHLIILACPFINTVQLHG